MARGKVGVDYDYRFGVKDGAGSPRTGLAAGAFTAIITNPQNDASTTATVSEGFAVDGGYLFTIPNAFTTTHGVGEYGITVALTSAPLDLIGDTVEFEPLLVNVNIEEISGSAEAAINLEASAETIVPATVDTASFAATTTVFETTLTEATADHYNGRVIIFTSGALQDQAAIITDYELGIAGGKLTVSKDPNTSVPLTDIPGNGDTFLFRSDQARGGTCSAGAPDPGWQDSPGTYRRVC